MPRVHVPDDHAHDPSAFVWSHYAPEIAKGAAGYIQAVYTKSLMSLRELEAARIRTAQINGCALCLGMRSARDLGGYLQNSGVDPQQAVSARGDPEPDETFYAEIGATPTWSGFSARERLIIEYAGRMGEAPQGIKHDDAFWEQMHASFSDAEIVDVTFCIGAWMALGRLTHVLDLDGGCMVPARAEAA
ncbi:carboxymuconolactone decarboxylase family protein [Sphingomonas sp. RT2P30]|uniref:carboxymuconolactone decarboxylase family protein n=1 Tax=Parasphingomonas halimpatiens TaxID=3096162 RepID=UPI002FC939E2